jgi:hypothetical protein
MNVRLHHGDTEGALRVSMVNKTNHRPMTNRRTCPELLETRCRSVEEMRLVNLLCHLVQYSEGLR